MKYIIAMISVLFFTHMPMACEFFSADSIDNTSKLMGKKSNFYNAYKQGKCVLEEALGSLPEAQKEIIANLIAKTYNLEN